MSNKNITKETNASVFDFIISFVDNDQKIKDSLLLIQLMKEWSGFEPRMWGPVMVGFGSYHYKYPSGHEGDAMLIWFSPTKLGLTLYIPVPGSIKAELLNKLGKHKSGKVCIYIKKMSDINLAVLEELCKQTIKFIGDHHTCACKEK